MEEATRELTRETDRDLSSGFQPHLPPGLSPSPTQGYVRSQKPQPWKPQTSGPAPDLEQGWPPGVQ